MTSGGDRKSADFSSRQNDALKRRTKDRISKELGIGSSTVERAECFADQYTKLQTGQNVQSAPKLGMNSKTELLETSRTALDQLNFELSAKLRAPKISGLPIFGGTLQNWMYHIPQNREHGKKEPPLMLQAPETENPKVFH